MKKLWDLIFAAPRKALPTVLKLVSGLLMTWLIGLTLGVVAGTFVSAFSLAYGLTMRVFGQ